MPNEPYNPIPVADEGEDADMELLLDTNDGGDEGASPAPAKPPIPVRRDQKLREDEAAKLAKKEEVAKVDPREDPSRIEYWQSRADKATKRADMLQAVEPVAQLLADRPDVREAIRKMVFEGTPPAAATKQEPELVKPEAPKKPDGYDEVSAVNDPTSDSFKYRLAKEAYAEKLVDYMEKRDAKTQGQLAQQMQHQQQQQQRQAAMAELKVKLQGHGIAGDEADEFITTMSDPQQVTLDNLVQLFRIKKGSTSDAQKAAQRAKDILDRKAKQASPPPLAVEGGEQPPSPAEEDEGSKLFSDSLMQGARKNRR